jgi:respiratory burst oxidase
MHNHHRAGGDAAGHGGDNNNNIVEMSGTAPHPYPEQERVVPHSGPLSKKSRARKSARFAESVSAPLSAPPPRARASPSATNVADDDYVEITLDVRNDSVAVHSVKPAAGGTGADVADVTLLARTLEKRSSSFGHAVIRNASSRIKQVSRELRCLASVNRHAGPGPRTIHQSKSAAAHTLKGIKFISRTDGAAGWPAVERRFNKLAENGLLHRSKFGECIG